jgi:hypothetical protein
MLYGFCHTLFSFHRIVNNLMTLRLHATPSMLLKTKSVWRFHHLRYFRRFLHYICFRLDWYYFLYYIEWYLIYFWAHIIVVDIFIINFFHVIIFLLVIYDFDFQRISWNTQVVTYDETWFFYFLSWIHITFSAVLCTR